MASEFSCCEEFFLVEGTRTTYQLGCDLIWEIGSRGSGWILKIPKGTKFDISVPRPLEWLQSPHDRRVLLGAAVHDELLLRGQHVIFAAAEFYRALRARRTPVARAWMLFFSTLAWTSARRALFSGKDRLNGSAGGSC